MSKAEYALKYFQAVWTWPTLVLAVLIAFYSPINKLVDRLLSSGSGEAQVGALRVSFQEPASPSTELTSDEIVRVANRTFGNEDVPIDGFQYVGCTFDHSTLIYKGEMGGGFNFCTFIEPEFKASGAAQRTIYFLSAMYHGGAQPVVEATLEMIKSGGYLQKQE